MNSLGLVLLMMLLSPKLGTGVCGLEEQVPSEKLMNKWLDQVEQSSLFGAVLPTPYPDRQVMARLVLERWRLRETKSVLARIHLAEVVWEISKNGDEVLPTLLAMYKDTKDASTKEKVIEVFRHSSGNAREEAIILPLLLEALKDSKTCGAAIEALTCVGPRKAVTPELIGFYRNSQNEEHRRMSLLALKNSELALPFLMSVIDEDSTDCKLAAIRSLSLMDKVFSLMDKRDQRDLFWSGLEKQLTKQREPSVRLALAELLGAQVEMQPNVVQKLLPWINDPDLGVRSSVITAMGYTREKEKPIVLEVLRKLLRHAEPKIRLQSAVSLWNIGEGSKESIGVVIKELRDKSFIDFCTLTNGLRDGVDLPTEVRELARQKGWINIPRPKLNLPD